MSREETRPDLHALLELDGVLTEIAALRDESDDGQFDRDRRFRWVLHRLWIAVGNEALAYTAGLGQPVRATKPWSNLYLLRNHLAHHRLPDVDKAVVRRITWLSADELRGQVRQLIRSDH